MRLETQYLFLKKDHSRAAISDIENLARSNGKIGCRRYGAKTGAFLNKLGIAIKIIDSRGSACFINKNSLKGLLRNNLTPNTPIKLKNLDDLIAKLLLKTESSNSSKSESSSSTKMDEIILNSYYAPFAEMAKLTSRSLLHYLIKSKAPFEIQAPLIQKELNDINNQNNPMKQSPLHLALSGAIDTSDFFDDEALESIDLSKQLDFCKIRPQIIKLLIENGANVNAQDINGNTPLHMVANEEIALMLLKAGANPNLLNEEKQPPLFILLNRALDEPTNPVFLPIAKTLLPASPALNTIDPKASFLSIAIKKTLQAPNYGIYLEITKFLLENGSTFKIADPENKLLLASLNKTLNFIFEPSYFKISQFLLENGASLKDADPNSVILKKAKEKNDPIYNDLINLIERNN